MSAQGLSMMQRAHVTGGGEDEGAHAEGGKSGDER